MPIVDLPRVEATDRLSEQVYQTLLEAILGGSLVPGEVVSELSLASSLGVSRTPVHDALVQLAKDGLICQNPKRRPAVARFSADDIREVFEMRRLLEGEAAAQAAPRIDRPSLQELRATARQLEQRWTEPGGVERWADFDENFHGTIAKASGNSRLEREILRYRRLHRGLNKTHTGLEILRQALLEHFGILDALDHRDSAAARTAMESHIREWQTYFIQNFSKE